MAGIHTVFDVIVDNGVTGKKLVIPFETRNDYETARTRLVALWTKHKATILEIAGEDSDPLLAYSLCADFKSDGDKDGSNGSSRGTFYLGKPRRKMAKNYSFEIVDDSVAANELPKVANDDNN
jgi:hypothetical protein